jgi:hypothetical protein
MGVAAVAVFGRVEPGEMRLSRRQATRMIRLEDLPEDVLESIYLEFGIEGPEYLPDVLPVRVVPVDSLPNTDPGFFNLDEEEYDHRDTGLSCSDYIDSMVPDARAGRLPPLVTRGLELADGRHRAEAYRRAGVGEATIIDVEEIEGW